MLVIRMQRTGRKGHAQFRVVVQDSRRTPTSGKIVTQIGHYNPHTKTATIDKEKASFYLEHGAQPSDRVIWLLKAEGVKLPKWVTISEERKRAVRNIEKRRSTRPAATEAVADKPAEPKAPAEEVPSVEPEAPAEETAPEQPSEETKPEAEETKE